MRLLEAIKKADAFRTNEISDEQKAAWLFELEGRVAGVVGVTAPANTFPEDCELLMPFPFDNIYEAYLAARIDLYYGDDLYANDMALFDELYYSATASWRRSHRLPKDRLKVM